MYKKYELIGRFIWNSSVYNICVNILLLITLTHKVNNIQYTLCIYDIYVMYVWKKNCGITIFFDYLICCYIIFRHHFKPPSLLLIKLLVLPIFNQILYKYTQKKEKEEIHYNECVAFLQDCHNRPLTPVNDLLGKRYCFL